MSQRTDQNTGTRDVREAHRFDEQRLLDYLSSHVESFHGPLAVSQFKGGQSNPTYLLDAASGRYVLRRKPPGKLLKSAHAVDREFRVISALYSTGFPVPRPLALCEDDEIIGTTFFVMEYVDGRIFWDLDLPGLEPDERSAIYDNVNATIARLHNCDYAAIGLADFGKPGNYFARQISRWSGQYRASETGTVKSMDALIDWLPENIPEDDSASIVHGDFRLDNMILHPTRPEVIAVLDWELSTIGHPLADFTYHLMTWQMPEIGIGSVGLAGKPLQELGIPDEEAYIEQYCRRTGRESGIPHRHFYSAFNFFRLAAILQGIAGRVRDGTAASAHAAQAVNAVQPLADLGWHFAKQG
ncbi:MAG: phosphotransferase family protein [Gammaproteobacteria bacterium]|nr:phosphotransferase family protein [Gammaproteobacteria bacterium]NNL49631.1 phosphotransferase family protein [Woeseiaceae bacterium]